MVVHCSLDKKWAAEHCLEAMNLNRLSKLFSYFSKRSIRQVAQEGLKLNKRFLITEVYTKNWEVSHRFTALNPGRLAKLDSYMGKIFKINLAELLYSFYLL